MPKKTKKVGKAIIITKDDGLMTELEAKAKAPNAKEKDILLYIVELLESR